MNRKVPLPGVAFSKIASENVMAPLVAVVSGELTANVTGMPIGSARAAGKVSDVWLSVANCGDDDTNDLKAQVNVKINGTTCLGTQPYISYVSGETGSQQKTTKVTGDSNIQQAALASTNTFSPGDVFSYDLALTRVASPTVEMANLTITVEFEPDEG